MIESSHTDSRADSRIEDKRIEDKRIEDREVEIKEVEIKEAPQSFSKEPLISIRGVSKKFCRNLKASYAYGLKDIASELLGTPRKSNRLRPGEFWAVKNVSLEVSRGESLGLIGTNGSGKTTLLKMIGGLIKPDTGTLKIHGKVAALIALGAGFNPLLTGRENVYINMSIFGLSKSEIDRKFDSVLDFAEIWDAIDAPVRTYSSGMRARLGFSCAIHTDPEILLIDEVLAVGDFTFRTKCYRRLAELREQGVAFILVSHSSAAILSNCDLVAYLSKGNLAAFGEAETVTRQYESDVAGKASAKADTNNSSQSLVSQGLMQSSLKIASIVFLNDDGEKVDSLETGESIKIRVYFSVSAPVENISVNTSVKSLSNANTTNLFLQSWKDIGFIPKISQKNNFITLILPQCGLVPGSYSMKVNLTENGKYFNILDIVESLRFKVKGTEISSQCSYYQPRAWNIEGSDSSQRINSGQKVKNSSSWGETFTSKSQKKDYFAENFPWECQLIETLRREKLTYCGFPKLENICQAISRVLENEAEGIYVEAGCALGGSAILIASMKPPDVGFKVFDIFGMIPPPSDRDGEDAHQRYAEIASGTSLGLGDNQYYGYINDLKTTVEENLRKFHLETESNNISLIEGFFENTMTFQCAIAFAHIDCDWYDSVNTCIERIAPHISLNGVMVFDDYNSYDGCKRAVDEWLKRDQRFCLKLVDRSAVVLRESL